MVGSNPFPDLFLHSHTSAEGAASGLLESFLGSLLYTFFLESCVRGDLYFAPAVPDG